TSAASCVSRARGRGRKSPPPKNFPRDELPHLSRLAVADGARAGPPVQALHGRGGAPARGGAAEPAGRAARRRGDLLRPRAPRLLRAAHRAEGRRGSARHTLVRAQRVGDDRAGARRLALVVLLLAGCGGGSHASHLDAAVDRVVSAGVPGTLVLVRDGDRTQTAAAGLADVGARRKLRPEDRFRVGSVTK